jgi:hypothetical protein
MAVLGGATSDISASRRFEPRSSGNSTKKVEPLPSSLITEIWPPISSASSRQMARPRPVPP